MDGLRFRRLPTSPRLSLECSGNENAPDGALLSDKALFDHSRSRLRYRLTVLAEICRSSAISRLL